MLTNLEYRIALGYAAVMGTGWLTIALRQWTIRQRYTQAAYQFFAREEGESGRLALGIAGARLSEVLIATLIMIVFAAAAVSLYRRSWNAWDWATVIVGLATVGSLIFLCASGRVIFAAPFTLAPMWLLLYRPGVKTACGVAPADTGDQEEAGVTEGIDPRQERATLVGLQQSLRVFEVERGIDTDVFVTRYTQGLEEDSPDNQEWFALARLARRSQERLAALNGKETDQV
jgi:hypothetical protein